MDQLDALNQVAEFHRTFKHPVEPTPLIPAPERCQLRVSLLAEELRELEEAIADKDIVAVADALCDIQYVLSGAVLEFGMGEQFRRLFDEVQRSNMSKVCHTIEEAEATVKFHEETRGIPCYYQEEDGVYLVYRTEDRKTLKSIYYSPADLERILAEQENLHSFAANDNNNTMASTKPPVSPENPIVAKEPSDMTNTIAFSSDMDLLFVIDDGKVSAYKLSHPNGVIIGTLRGQVVASTAEGLPAESEVLQRISISLQRTHWTTFYRRPQQTLNVIGATDIDVGLVGSKDNKATVHRLSIGGNPVHIRRSGNTITFSLMKA